MTSIGGAMASATAGMAAAVARLDASAQNVANMESRGATPGSGAGGPQVYRPVRAVQSSVPGGVATTLSPTTPGWLPAFDPQSSFADANGQVAAPDVDLGGETVEQIGARAQFSANLKVLQTGDEMLKSLLDLKA